MKPRIVITCEHGGNQIPAEYAAYFRSARGALRTHRGWDPGALPLARRLATEFSAPLHFSEISRLLVDLNRSEQHPRVFSEWSRPLAVGVRDAILSRWYRPYRRRVEREIAGLATRNRRVVHVSVHSFTPILNGAVRRADIGLLYDPARAGEFDLCAQWQAELREREPGLTVLRNSPYRGTSDGFTTYLRTRFRESAYIGLELEINQRLLDQKSWRRFQSSLIDSLAACLPGT